MKIFFSCFLSLSLILLTGCKDNLPESEGNWNGCMVGMFTADSTASFPANGEQGILEFEKLIQHQVGSVLIYPTWADSFPAEECRLIAKTGAIPHLTWELFWPEVTYNTAPVDSNGYTAMDEVLSGKHDAYIKKFAADAKAYEGKVMIRFLHEFNGNWYMWGGRKNGAGNGGPQKVVAVWKYVVDMFRSAGADNVKWVWCPHGPSPDLSLEKWNDVRNYWPGNEYVDWIGLDAYNWYPRDPWGGDRPYDSFYSCFRALYDSCAVLGKQPMMIAEFASGEFTLDSLNKSTWITEAFTQLKNDYPRIKIFTWFNIKKELDWRVNSSPESYNAFLKAMMDPYYIGHVSQP